MGELRCSACHELSCRAGRQEEDLLTCKLRDIRSPKGTINKARTVSLHLLRAAEPDAPPNGCCKEAEYSSITNPALNPMNGAPRGLLACKMLTVTGRQYWGHFADLHEQKRGFSALVLSPAGGWRAFQLAGGRAGLTAAAQPPKGEPMEMGGHTQLCTCMLQKLEVG